MGLDGSFLLFAGGLIGGFVNGLTGFGTGLTAMGLWLYAVPPPVAAALVALCSVVSQVQTLPLIWGRIEWRRVLPFVGPGLLGVPLGSWLLSQVDPQVFKIGVGLFLLAYSSFVLCRGIQMRIAWGGRTADGAVGFGGGILGGFAGFSGVLPILWTDIRGYTKEHRRSVLQTFNLLILFAALISYAFSGQLTKEFGWASLIALPGTIGGAWLGSLAYKRIGDQGFQKVVMVLLFVSGLLLIVTSR